MRVEQSSAEPGLPIWTGAFTLCVLGMYVKKTGLS